MAHKLNINWHAFYNKNKTNTEVAKMPKNIIENYFLSSDLR